MTTALAEAVASCGEGLDIRPPILIEYGERVPIGSHVFINNDFMVLGSGRVRIGDHVLIGSRARFSTPNRPVGARSVFGAGSVVTKDVPADVVVAGNPARIVRRI